MHQYLTELKEGYLWTSILHVTVSIYSIVNLILLLLVPLFLFHFFRKNSINFRERKFSRKFGDATDILTHRRRRSAWYFVTYCYRRFFMMVFVVFANRGYF